MSDDRSPGAVHVPLLIGEAFGRVEVPLPALPDGVVALTVPRTGPEGDRVPLDRKGRIRVAEVDLVAGASVEAFLPPATLTSRELAWVLETGSTRRWSTVEAKLGDRAWPVSVDLIRAGGVVVRCRVDVLAYHPHSWRLSHAWASQADDLLQEMRGRVPPDVARADLLTAISDVPQLSDEHALLAAIDEGTPLRVPVGSRTRAGTWPVYEAALRAACFWWPAQVPGRRRLTMRELAGKALGGSKKWTPARQQAFENLVDLPFDEAVDKAEYEIRVAGPLRWFVGSVAADASIGRPWIGLPSDGIRLVGRIERNAHGVLVVENSDTFKQICIIPAVTERWLCVWGKGTVADGVVAFLKSMHDIPIAAWCDLDAYGIRILGDLARRVERDITPVGMTPDLYLNGTKYRPEDLAESQRIAEKMADEGPLSLRDLAAMIARSEGLGCEQETLYDEVLPTLAGQLRQLEHSESTPRSNER